MVYFFGWGSVFSLNAAFTQPVILQVMLYVLRVDADYSSANIGRKPVKGKATCIHHIQNCSPLIHCVFINELKLQYRFNSHIITYS
jgi:hypothetical protein